MCHQQNHKKTSYITVIKKTLHPKEQLREDVERKRNDWKNEQASMDINKLIFLDETSINAGMTRLYGRTLKGKRVNDYVPDMHFKRISILSSVRLNGEMKTIYFEGTLNGELFAEYIYIKFSLQHLKTVILL